MVLAVFRALWFFLSEFTMGLLRYFLPQAFLKRKDLTGQVVLVTGGGNGLGRLTATKLAAPEVCVVLWDIDDKALEEAKKECEEKGAKALTFHVDMSSKEAIYEGAKKTLNAVERVDIVVNNAGIGFGIPFLKTTDAQNQKVIEVNMLAHVWMAKAFLPAMAERNSGHLITIASLAGIIGVPSKAANRRKYVSALVDYSASKFGALGFQEGLENEMATLGLNGIKFTTVCPSFVATRLMDNLAHYKNKDNLDPEYVTDEIVEAILMEKRIICLPAKGNLLYIVKGILPRTVYQAILFKKLPH